MIQDYYILDYIQSSGSQYIDTGITFNQNYKFEGVMSATKNDNGDYKYCGSASTGHLNMVGQFNGVYRLRGGSDYWGNTDVVVDLLPHTFTINDNLSNKIDGIEKSTCPNTFCAEATFLIGKCNGETSASNCKYYSIKFWLNGVLYRDFVPAMRKSDSVVGLYDKANDTFYTNAGSGTFTYGQIVPQVYSTINPSGSGNVSVSESSGVYTIQANNNSGYRFLDWTLDGYTQLEYIESSGTQYIDTNFTPNQDTSIYLVGSNFVNEERALFGSSGNGTLYNFARVGDGNIRSQYRNEYNFPTSGSSFATYNFIVDSQKNVWKLTYGSSQSVATKTFTYSSFTAIYTMYIFSSHGSSSVTSTAKYKLYSCKIYDNGTIARDFIPVIRHSDGQIGLLDLVHLKFYGNSGSGVFSGGNPV